MNRNALIGLIAVVIFAAGGWYLYSNNGATRSAGTQTPPNQEQGQMLSMKELMASNASQQCTFAEPQSDTSGTIYVSGGKVRGDFETKSESGTVSGHMIADSSTVHTWMDGMSQGFKASFDVAATADKNMEAQQSLNPDKKLDYRCSPWQADRSKFELPAGVTFTDMSAMMQQSAGGSGASACSACDMAPEPQKSQCKAALKCK